MRILVIYLQEDRRSQGHDETRREQDKWRFKKQYSLESWVVGLMFQNQVNGTGNTFCKHIQTAKEITKNDKSTVDGNITEDRTQRGNPKLIEFPNR